MILFSDKNRFTRQTAKNISTKVRYLSIKKRNRGTNDFTDKTLYPVLSPGQKEKAGLIGERWSKKNWKRGFENNPGSQPYNIT